MMRPSINRWWRGTAAVVLFVYVVALLVPARGWVPQLLRNWFDAAQNGIFQALRPIVSVFHSGRPSHEVVGAVYFFVIAGLAPLLASMLLGRGPRDIGMRIPNKLFWRYFVIAVVLAAPFLWWMVQSPTMAGTYLRQLERLGWTAFCGYYLVNMLTEHFLLHGVVLGLTRPDGRWRSPLPPPERSGGSGGMLAWLGLKNSSIANGRRETWLGIPAGSLFPIAFSALLFGMVHLGKDTRELVLSFPGGVVQGYLALRSDSWLTPLIIHLATASIALLMMLFQSRANVG